MWLEYIAYDSSLNKDEKKNINRQVSKNRKMVFSVVRTVGSNTKETYQKLILISFFGGVILFTNLNSAEAIGLSMPPAPVVRVQPSYPDNPNQPKLISLKNDFSDSKNIEQVLVWMALNNPRLVSNQTILRIVQKTRGGSLIEATLFLALIVILFSTGDGFIPNDRNPGWGIDRANQFQPPGGVHKYPQDLFFPRTSYADRPGGSQIMSRQSSRNELNEGSTNVAPTQTQMYEFTKTDGTVDLEKCLQEVRRRASELGCTNFECSFERFKALATEANEIKPSTAREAITVLQGEMEGYYQNARRENYGLEVRGPDFLVDGIGEFKNVTHVEVKNPVGSAIKIARNLSGSISKQGKAIGKKIDYQQNFWSNPNERSKIKTLNTTASFPQAPNNVLATVDNFDVPTTEKAFMEESIVKNVNKSTNIVFLN